MSMSYRQLARATKQLAVERGDWSGLPIPVAGLDITLEPRFPYRVDEMNKKPDGETVTVVNRWFSSRLRCNVVITRDDAGKLGWTFELHNPLDFIIGTIGATYAWLPEAELQACEKLSELIGDSRAMQYHLCGTFMETSKRSGVTYVFRKLRPTVAMKADANGVMTILCALCLHPVGYYSGTWAGCQTPTDDVVAHLVMMRGDEPKFWANANQHPATNPASGL